MQNISNLLIEKNYIFKSITKFELSSINIKKKLSCYVGVDLKSFYVLIVKRDASSRLLSKDAIFLDDLCAKIEEYKNHKIKKKIIFINSKICSKSLTYLKNSKWKVFNDTV